MRASSSASSAGTEICESMNWAMPAARAPGTSVSPNASRVSASSGLSRRSVAPWARAARGVSSTSTPPIVNASAPIAAPRINSRRLFMSTPRGRDDCETVPSHRQGVTADSHYAKVNRWRPPDNECCPAGRADLLGGGAGSDRGGIHALAEAGARAREAAARTCGTRRHRAAAARIASAFLHLRAAGLRNFLLAPLGLSRSSRSFRLMCHPGSASEAVRSVAARVHRTGEGIAVTYSLKGQLDRLRIPPPRPPRIAARLWQHTCCEIFVARQSLPGYHEFNLAPSGEWAAYAFARYRDGAPLVDEKLDKRMAVRRSAEKLGLEAFIRVAQAALAWALRR